MTNVNTPQKCQSAGCSADIVATNAHIRKFCSRACSRREACRRWRRNNPERSREIAKKFDLLRHDRKRDYILKFKYGINQKQKEELLASQGNRCASCRTDDPGKGTNKAWHVDHCHKTGKVRGILCSRCNQAIGLLGDSSFKAFGVASYLLRTM